MPTYTDRHQAEIRGMSEFAYRQEQQQQQEQMYRLSSGPGVLDMVFGVVGFVFTLLIGLLKMLIWLIVEPIKWFAKLRRKSM